jgi:hypothetical protein
VGGGVAGVGGRLDSVSALLGSPVAPTVLARGLVRHVDDHKVYLPSWAKVVRNTEPVADDGIARMDGIRWID